MRDIFELLILVLLDEEPCHGYGLMERFQSLGFSIRDPSVLYKRLLALEEEGFVEGTWELKGRPRKLYCLTPKGKEHLERCYDDLERTLENLYRLLKHRQQRIEKGG